MAAASINNPPAIVVDLLIICHPSIAPAFPAKAVEHNGEAKPRRCTVLIWSMVL